MKGKLIKTDVNYLLEDDKGVVVASTSTKERINGLSKQNCDEIFGVVDVIDVVYKQVRNGFDGVIDSFTEAFAKECINKAMELMGDKKFSEDDVISIIEKSRKTGLTIQYLSLANQQTEWDVEIVEECLDKNCDGINKKGVCITTGKPKLDKEGCLILKKL
jgi:hypothetical protein